MGHGNHLKESRRLLHYSKEARKYEVIWLKNIAEDISGRTWEMIRWFQHQEWNKRFRTENVAKFLSFNWMCSEYHYLNNKTYLLKLLTSGVI